MRRGLAATLLFICVTVCYAVTAFVGQHQSTDTVATFSPAWELARHGNVWMDRLVGHSDWLVHSATGHWVSARFPGAILVGAPFYLPVASSMPTVGPSLVASVLASSGAVTVVFLVLDRLVSRSRAVGATLLGAFGTATWNVSATALWTHGPAQLALACAVLGLVTGRRVLAGGALGVAIVIRPPLAVVAVVVVLAAVLRARSVRAAFAFVPGLVVSVGVLLAYNSLVFGAFGVDSGYSESGARNVGSGPLDFLGNVPGFLFSPARGLLVLSPFVLVLLPRLRGAWRRSSPVARDCAVAGAAYLLLELWLLPFSGSDGFYGYRLPLESLVLWAPLLTISYSEWATTRPRRVVFAVFAAASVAFESAAAWLSHPPLLAPDAWHTFMPGQAVAAEPLPAAMGALVGVVCVVAWFWLTGRLSAPSSVRTN